MGSSSPCAYHQGEGGALSPCWLENNQVGKTQVDDLANVAVSFPYTEKQGNRTINRQLRHHYGRVSMRPLNILTFSEDLNLAEQLKKRMVMSSQQGRRAPTGQGIILKGTLKWSKLIHHYALSTYRPFCYF